MIVGIQEKQNPIKYKKLFKYIDTINGRRNNPNVPNIQR